MEHSSENNANKFYMLLGKPGLLSFGKSLNPYESVEFVSVGPFKVNGVPMRRVAQSYVIATQTSVDISGVTLPEKLNDDYFKREPRKKKRSDDMFEEAEEVRFCLSNHNCILLQIC